ncbi:MAG: FISUMP domain-containing protein [Bacteroidota bacterium]
MKTLKGILLILLIIVLFNSCKKKELPIVNTWDIAVFSEAVRCSGTLKGEGVVERGFKWRTDQEPDYQNGKTAIDNRTNYFVTTILGLSPRTTYYLKAYATNSEGTAYSLEREIITSQTGTFTDNRDSKTYKWVEIGDQIWMAENLSYLPFVSSYTSDTGIYVFNYTGTSADIARKQEEYKKYGCLYSWEIALEVCPDGWHLPSRDEWEELEETIVLNSEVIYRSKKYYAYYGDFLKEAESNYWSSPLNKPNNATSFSALPAGYHFRTFDSSSNKDIYFLGMGTYTGFWSSTTFSDFSFVIALSSGTRDMIKNVSEKNYGYSIRCLKDQFY